jgi:hypothetical protein
MASVTCPNCNSVNQIPDQAWAFRCPTCAADIRYYDQAPTRPPPRGWRPGWHIAQGATAGAGYSPQTAGREKKPMWKRPWVWVVAIILLLIIGSLPFTSTETSSGGDSTTGLYRRRG